MRIGEKRSYGYDSGWLCGGIRAGEDIDRDVLLDNSEVLVRLDLVCFERTL